MLFQWGFSSGVLILLILFLRLAAIYKLPKRVFMILWDIALLRLLIPFSLPIPYSIVWPVARAVNSIAKGTVFFRGAMSREKTGSVTVGTMQPLRDYYAGILMVWLVGAVMLFGFFAIWYCWEYRQIQAALPIPEEKAGCLRVMGKFPEGVQERICDDACNFGRETI